MSPIRRSMEKMSVSVEFEELVPSYRLSNSNSPRTMTNILSKALPGFSNCSLSLPKLMIKKANPKATTMIKKASAL